MGNNSNWIKIDPQTVPAEQREVTRFINEAFSKVTAAANGAPAADREDIVMMAIEADGRQKDGHLNLNRCKGTAANYGKQCGKCKKGEQHKFADFVPQNSLEVAGDDKVLSIAECEESESPWAGHITPHWPDYYMSRREDNAMFGRRLNALPKGKREVANLIDATHDAVPKLTNRAMAEMLTQQTGVLWTERRYRRTLGRLKLHLLEMFPEKLRRISKCRGQLG